MTLLIGLSFCLTVLSVCAFAAPIGRAFGLMDHPDGERKVHGRPTPLVGGLALMSPLVALAALEAVQRPATTGVFAALAVGGAGSALLGTVDDRYRISPVARLLASVGLYAALIWIEPELLLTTLDFGGPGLDVPLYAAAVPFTLLCVAGMQNAVNMADGKNGLVISLAMFWVLCLLLYAPEGLVFFLGLFLVGLGIVFIYNCAGELFLGDAGSYAIGALIGALMIYVYNSAGGQLPMMTVVLWLLVPVLDCLRLIVERLRAGRSPLSADRNHFHHYLAERWPWSQALAIYLMVAAAPGLVAAIWPEHTFVLLVATVILYGEILRGVRRPASSIRNAAMG